MRSSRSSSICPTIRRCSIIRYAIFRRNAVTIVSWAFTLLRRVLLRDQDLVMMSAVTVEQYREMILDLIKHDLTIAQTDYE
jgi:hypothetical protein